VNHLFRDLAPISEAAWSEIETEARRSLENFLGARKLVDFTGPHGWEASALSLGTIEALPSGPVEGVESSARSPTRRVPSRSPRTTWCSAATTTPA
jgi:uncharacterized linocin/CFP29 family protein